VTSRQRNVPEWQNLSEIRILFVGRLIPLKGAQDLIKAFSLFSAGRRDYFLDIVGDGPEKKSLEKLVSDLALGDNVIFHGYQKDVTSFYEKAQIFVLSSYTEGMSLSFLEAMSFGLAIVATEITSIPECVSDGESALLVKPRDIFQMSLALKKLATDPALMRSLGARARHVFQEKFTLEKMIARYRIQYRML
jgi:glycosyltransferase involved in cell wall biosynthesis